MRRWLSVADRRYVAFLSASQFSRSESWCLFRHARRRQIVRSTRNLPLAQRQAGWSRLQMPDLTVGDEARQLMQQVPE